MKDKIGLLFKRNEKLGAAPILFVFLGLLIVFALFYFLVLNKEKDVVTPPTVEETTEEVSLMDKIKGLFGSSDENPEANTGSEVALPTIPTIPPEALTLDEELVKEEEVIIALKTEFELNEVEIKDVGRRDPMRKIVGDNVGTFDKERINDKAADVKDESLNYFGGVTIDDIILNKIILDPEDDKLKGDFIINGSMVKNLEVGDYLLELYYVKEFNSKGNYVILQYKDDTYQLKEQNIYNTHSSSK